MSDINNLYNNLTNFYNVNDENFKEFMAKLYDEMKANHRDVKYVKEHLPEEIEKKLVEYENGAIMQQIDLTSVSNIAASYTNTLDILIPNVTTNKIVLPNPADVPYKQYTLYVRNSNGSRQTVTYGGLDTTNLVTNNAVKTSLNAGEMQVINIVKIPLVSKWLIQNIFDSKVF